MNNLDLPFTPLALEQYLKEIASELQKHYVFNSNFLMNIYSNYSKGNNITSVLNATELNTLYDAVNAGYEITATGNNKYFKILYADIEEIASDDYKAVKIVFIKDSELIKFVFSKFGTTVYLDTKTITAI